MIEVYWNLSDEIYALSQKKQYYEYVVLMTMNSESSSFQSTLYDQIWRYHGFKRPYVRTLQDVSIISVGEFGYLCILNRLLFRLKELNLTYVSNDVQDRESYNVSKEYYVGRLNTRQKRRRILREFF